MGAGPAWADRGAPDPPPRLPIVAPSCCRSPSRPERPVSTSPSPGSETLAKSDPPTPRLSAPGAGPLQEVWFA